MKAALRLAALAALTAAAAAQEDAKAALWAKLSQATTQTARIKLLTNDSDFVFNFLDPTAERTQGAGGFIVSANSGTFPALFGHGMAMALGVIGPCAMNSPHTHPRATEFNVALNGTLYTGMLAENGARFVVNDVPTLSATVFPRGAIHFEANLGCQPVYFIAGFNDPDPGVLQVAQRFYGLPPAVVGQSLGGLGVEEVVSVAKLIPDNIIFAADECFKRCGIQKPASQPGKQQQPRVSGNAYPDGAGSPPPAGGAYPAMGGSPPPASGGSYPAMGGAPAPAGGAYPAMGGGSPPPAGGAYPAMGGSAPPPSGGGSPYPSGFGPPAGGSGAGPAGGVSNVAHGGGGYSGGGYYGSSGGMGPLVALASGSNNAASSSGSSSNDKLVRTLLIVVLAINGVLVVGILGGTIAYCFRKRKSSAGRGMAGTMGFGSGTAGKYGRAKSAEDVVFSAEHDDGYGPHGAPVRESTAPLVPRSESTPVPGGPGATAKWYDDPYADRPRERSPSPGPGAGPRRSY